MRPPGPEEMGMMEDLKMVKSLPAEVSQFSYISIVDKNKKRRKIGVSTIMNILRSSMLSFRHRQWLLPLNPAYRIVSS